MEDETWCHIFAVNNIRWLRDTYMNTIDSEQLTKLIRDPTIVRIKKIKQPSARKR